MKGPSIPWAMIAPHEGRALRNHGGQSLERLAERGGLDPIEIRATLEERGFVEPFDPKGDLAWLQERVREWDSAESRAEAAMRELAELRGALASWCNQYEGKSNLMSPGLEELCAKSRALLPAPGVAPDPEEGLPFVAPSSEFVPAPGVAQEPEGHWDGTPCDGVTPTLAACPKCPMKPPEGKPSEVGEKVDPQVPPPR